MRLTPAPFAGFTPPVSKQEFQLYKRVLEVAIKEEPENIWFSFIKPVPTPALAVMLQCGLFDQPHQNLATI